LSHRRRPPGPAVPVQARRRACFLLSRVASFASEAGMVRRRAGLRAAAVLNLRRIVRIVAS
jgi:hypothetical protein